MRRDTPNPATFKSGEAWRRPSVTLLALRSARRASFTEIGNLSIPVLPIEHLDEKRAALSQRLAQPLAPAASKCVRIPEPDEGCPRNFAAWQKRLLSALLTTHVLQAHPHVKGGSEAMECSSMGFKMAERLLPTNDAQMMRTHELDASDVCEWLGSSQSHLEADECLLLPDPPNEYGQEIARCLKKRSGSPEHSTEDDGTSALYALGPHALYGAVFEAAFALPNEEVPAWLDDELRISIHLDHHWSSGHSGHHMFKTMQVIEADLNNTASTAKRCAVLFASNRQLTTESQELNLMEGVARRVGCRLLRVTQTSRTSRRVPSELKGGAAATSTQPETLQTHRFRETGREHEYLEDDALLRDVFLLAHGHLLIGTFGSPLSIVIQQLIAARSVGLPVLPTVSYCDIWMHKCLQPLPLLTNEQNDWSLTVYYTGAVRIAYANNVGIGDWVPFPQPEKASAGEWPPSDEAVAALQQIKWPAVQPPEKAWLGVIISANVSGDRYRSVASSVTSCGFVAHHVQAVTPKSYTSMEEMLDELFGTVNRRATRMSPYEVGLVLSHRRALFAIARGPYAWGAIFEDDAYLHQELLPWQAAHMLHKTFTAAGSSSNTFVYLGACGPTCQVDIGLSGNIHADRDLPTRLLRGGHCRGFCTHAYALSRNHATTFFNDVFDCGNGTERCGAECAKRPCFMDWAFHRHFTRGHAAWLLGAGLSSPFAAEHRGIFVQNRTGVSNRGTTLSGRYKFAKERQKEIEDRKQCGEWIGSTRVVEAYNATQLPLRKVFVTYRWTGRVGNLLFGAAALMGVAAQLNTIVPTTAFATHLPSTVKVPAKELFHQFPRLSDHVRVQRHGRRDDGGDGYTLEQLTTFVKLKQQLRSTLAFLVPQTTPGQLLRQCQPCTWTMAEEYSSVYETTKLERLKAWVRSPPEGCIVGLVELVGYFQSYKYFDSIAESAVHPALTTAPTAQHEADAILAAARRATSADLLIGVQVRLGDKLNSIINVNHRAHSEAMKYQVYAPTAWEYYKTAMIYVARNISGSRWAHTKRRQVGPSVAFVVTAGGSIGNNTEDMEEARQHLSSGSSRIFFSPSQDPHVDLAVLRGCDGLVIGPSTLGWWAAFLSRLSAGRVVAPMHIVNPELPRWHPLKKGFVRRDHYPPHWKILNNDGVGGVKNLNWEEEEQYLAKKRVEQLQMSGLRLNAGEHVFANKALSTAQMAARLKRAKALSRAGLRDMIGEDKTLRIKRCASGQTPC